jgi:hypothetical protein
MALCQTHEDIDLADRAIAALKWRASGSAVACRMLLARTHGGEP